VSKMREYNVEYIPLSKLVDSPFQPRMSYRGIKELAASINQIGLREPLLVRPLPDGRYEIVHGHRRKRALELLKIPFAPCYVEELSDKEAFEINLSQNIQDEAFNPIEEGKAFKKYIKLFGVSIRELAKRIGKDVKYVSRRIKLLELPEDIQRGILEGRISLTSVRPFIDRGIEDEGIIREVLKRVEKKEVGVAQLEEVAREIKKGRKVEEAITIAKVKARQMLIIRRALRGQSNPTEIVKRIFQNQVDPEEIKRGIIETNLAIVREMVERGLLKCPHCGSTKIVCGECGGDILEQV